MKQYNTLSLQIEKKINTAVSDLCNQWVQKLGR